MKTYSLLHINIEKKKHLDKIDKVITEKDPDFICMEEIGSEDIIKISKKFGYHYIHASKFFSEGTQQGQGQGILSKHELFNIKRQRYDLNSTKLIPRFFTSLLGKYKPYRPPEQFEFHETLLSGEVLLEDKKLTIATTHFPVADLTSPGMEDHELYDIEAFKYTQNARNYFDRFLSKIKKLPKPLIFTSDLNNPRGEYIYDALAHELVDQIPEEVNSSIDPNLHRVKKLKLMVDTVMTSNDVKVEKVEVLEGVSDHKGFLSTFHL